MWLTIHALQDALIYNLFIMQTALHYFLNFDFRLDFALHLLLKKEKGFPALHVVLPSNPGFTLLLLQIK